MQIEQHFLYILPLRLCVVASQVQVAVDKRAVDTDFLIKIACGRVLCAAVEQILETASQKISVTLNRRIRRFYSVHIFHSMARLDVPTWDDPVVTAQIQNATAEDLNLTAWTAIKSVVQTVTILLSLFSETAVLVSVLHEQRDGFLLSLLSFSGAALTCFDATGTDAGDINGGKRRPFAPLAHS